MQKTFNCLIFFPRRSVCLKAAKPNHENVVPSGVGRLIYEKRTQRGMSKRSLAEELQVHPMVIGQWESGKHYPQISYHPRIIAFLDSDEWLPRGSFAYELARVRSVNGWARSELADRLDISERTLGRWEKGEEPPYRLKVRILSSLKALEHD